MKKKYVLKKEVKDELIQLGIEVLGIIAMISLIALIIMFNAVIF